MVFIFLMIFACSDHEKESSVDVPVSETDTTTHTDSDGHHHHEEFYGDCDDNTFPVDRIPHSERHEHGQTVPEREDALPVFLSETGLYVDILSKETHPAMQLYTPRFQLWSDAADKMRWAYIPECGKINTSDMNDWSFPVGSRFFKEFSIDGVRIETRIIERLGDGPRDFAFASYLWNDDQTEAVRVDPGGLKNAKGTQHDIPSKQACLRCHGTYETGGGRPSRALGFSALQLDHQDGGLSLLDLVRQEKLTDYPTHPMTIPGDSLTQQALGLLHANCGNCHNDSTDGLPQNDLNLWIDVGLHAPTETGAYQTGVNQPTAFFKDQHVSGRIVPGKPQESAVLYRMSQRNNAAQMPPIATKAIDVQGVQIIQSWIEALE